MVFVGFFSLAALATIGDSARVALRSRVPRLPRVLGFLLLAIVTVAALLDQTVGSAPLRRANAENARSDRALAGAIVDHFGPDVMILQVPLLGFPEDTLAFPATPSTKDFVLNGQAIYTAFDLLRPTLYTDRVRWSYGRMQARPGDVAASLREKPTDLFLTEAVAAGFGALYIDRDAFPDDAQQLTSELETRVGKPVVSSASDRMLVYDLRDYSQRWRQETAPAEIAAVVERVRKPLDISWGPSVSPAYGIGQYFPKLDGFSAARFARNMSFFRLSNPSANARQITMHLAVTLLSAGTGHLTVTGGVTDVTSVVTNVGTPLAITTTIPPGTTTFRISTDQAEISLPPPVGNAAIRIEGAWFEG